MQRPHPKSGWRAFLPGTGEAGCKVRPREGREHEWAVEQQESGLSGSQLPGPSPTQPPGKGSRRLLCFFPAGALEAALWLRRRLWGHSFWYRFGPGRSSGQRLSYSLSQQARRSVSPSRGELHWRSPTQSAFESSGSCNKSLHRSWLKTTPVHYLTVLQVRCLQQDSLGYSGSRLCSLWSLCGRFCFWRQTACLGSWPPLPPSKPPAEHLQVCLSLWHSSLSSVYETLGIVLNPTQMTQGNPPISKSFTESHRQSPLCHVVCCCWVTKPRPILCDPRTAARPASLPFTISWRLLPC